MKLNAIHAVRDYITLNLNSDACGVGFVAHLKGIKSHDIITKGLELLRNLDHRGAVGAEKNSGDGAGILTQMPDKFLRRVVKKSSNIDLPEYVLMVSVCPRSERTTIL